MTDCITNKKLELHAKANFLLVPQTMYYHRLCSLGHHNYGNPMTATPVRVEATNDCDI